MRIKTAMSLGFSAVLIGFSSLSYAADCSNCTPFVGWTSISSIGVVNAQYAYILNPGGTRIFVPTSAYSTAMLAFTLGLPLYVNTSDGDYSVKR